MKTSVGSLLMVVVLAAIGHQGRARPQGGGLSIADLIPTQGIQVRPEDEVTLYDLTRDALNEVNAAARPRTTNNNRYTDDITFLFPAGSGGGSPNVGQRGPSYRPAGSSSTFNTDFGISSSSSSGVLGQQSPVLSVDTPGSDDVQFRLPVSSSSFNTDFGISSSSSSSSSGVLGQQTPVLSVDTPGSDDVQFRLPVSTFSPGFGPSSGSVDIRGEPSVLSVNAPGSDDVQFAFPDPTVTANGPIPSAQDPGQFFSTQPKTSSSGNSVPGFDVGLSTGFDQGTAFSDPASAFPGVDATAGQVPFSEPAFDAQFPNQDNTQLLAAVDSTQFGEVVSPQSAGNPLSSLSADLGVDLSSILDFKTSDVPAVDVVLQRTLGDGNQKGFNIRNNNNNNNQDLLALLTRGLLDKQQSSTNVGSNNNPIKDILSAGADPLKKVFNLLTLGLFDNNRSQSNPLKDLLNTLTLGLLGPNQSSSRRTGGFDLSKIGLGEDAIAELAQVASSGLDDFARETSAGIRLAQDEVRFMSRENLQRLIGNLQQTGTTVGIIGQNTYRSVLQKKDALAKLLLGIVTNMGTFVNSSVGDAFEKVGTTANVFGRFINDLKVGLINSMISKGENVRELVTGTLGSVGTAFTDFTKAAQNAAEDNIRSITGIKSLRKFR